MRLPDHRFRAGALALALVLPRATGTTCQISTEASTGELRVSGTVHLLAVEGGCWQLEATDGTRYELRPEQAPAGVLRDGAEVTLVVRPRDDLGSTCMVGRVVDVRRVEAVRAPADEQ
jgi:hypothetical protein